MYGGQCMQPYLLSVMELQRTLIDAGVRHDFLFTSGESLITRARNTSAATFLQTDYDWLFFIDSDIQFTPDDVAALYNADAGHVKGAAYPWKQADISNTTAWKDGELVDIGKLSGPTEVDYLGTGFLMIHRRAFEQIREAWPELHHTEGKVGDCWSFFDTEIRDGVYLSEDYLFCQRWRDLGEKVMLIPEIRLRHWGLAGYGVPAGDLHRVQV